MADRFQHEATQLIHGLGLFTISIPYSEFNEGVREADRADRKSLSYQQIADVQTIRLQWAGKGLCINPPCNPFWSGVSYDHRNIELRERRAG